MARSVTFAPGQATRVNRVFIPRNQQRVTATCKCHGFQCQELNPFVTFGSDSSIFSFVPFCDKFYWYLSREAGGYIARAQIYRRTPSLLQLLRQQEQLPQPDGRTSPPQKRENCPLAFGSIVAIGGNGRSGPEVSPLQDFVWFNT